MNLPKAREILELNIKEAGKKMPPDTLQALKLGVEALKLIVKLRIVGLEDDADKLLGETEGD